jgi:hypothetical protein
VVSPPSLKNLQASISAGTDPIKGDGCTLYGARATSQIRRYLRGRPDPFRPVCDLGLVSPGCPGWSGASEGCSFVWLPAWLPALIARRLYVTGDGPRPVRPGSAWLLSSGRSVRRGSKVKRDFACTFTRHLLPVRFVLRSHSCLKLEADTYTQRAIPRCEPSQDSCTFQAL